jgi:hypothetical protein
MWFQQYLPALLKDSGSALCPVNFPFCDSFWDVSLPVAYSARSALWHPGLPSFHGCDDSNEF